MGSPEETTSNEVPNEVPNEIPKEAPNKVSNEVVVADSSSQKSIQPPVVKAKVRL